MASPAAANAPRLLPPEAVAGGMKRKASSGVDDNLESFTREALIAEVKRLRSQCQQLQAAAAARPKPTSNPAPAATKNLPEVAAHVMTTITRQIKKQLVWKASCRTGKARWSYASMVPEDVFKLIMHIPMDKPAKGRKMTLQEFKEVVLGGNDVYGKVRYDVLCLTGTHVNVTYSNGEMKMGGTYGK